MYSELPVKSCCVHAQDMHIIHRHRAWLERYISGFDPTLTSNFSTRDSIHHRKHTVLEIISEMSEPIVSHGRGGILHQAPFLASNSSHSSPTCGLELICPNHRRGEYWTRYHPVSSSPTPLSRSKMPRAVLAITKAAIMVAPERLSLLIGQLINERC